MDNSKLFGIAACVKREGTSEPCTCQPTRRLNHQITKSPDGGLGKYGKIPTLGMIVVESTACLPVGEKRTMGMFDQQLDKA